MLLLWIAWRMLAARALFRWFLEHSTFSQDRALHESIAASRCQFSTTECLMHHWRYCEEVNRVVYLSITRLHYICRCNSWLITFLSSCVFLCIVNVYRHLIWLGTHLSFTFDHVDGCLEFVRLEIAAKHIRGTRTVILRVIINNLLVAGKLLVLLCQLIWFMFRMNISHIKVCREMRDITIVPILAHILLIWACRTHVIDEVFLC